MKINSIISPPYFLYDVLTTTLGQIIIMAIAFLLNKFLSSHLEIADFGVYNLIRRASTVSTYVMLMAMGIALPKYLAAYHEKRNEIKFARYYICALLITSIATLVLAGIELIFSSQLSLLVFGDKKYSGYVMPMVFYSIGQVATTFLYAYYRANGKFVRYSVSQITVQCICLIVAIFFSDSVEKVIWVWGLANCIYALACLSVATKKLWIQAEINIWKDINIELKELLSYGAPRVPGEFILFSFNLLPLLIVSHKYSMEEAAYFSAAITVNTMITPLFSFVGIVLLPLVSKSIVSKQLTEMENKIRGLMFLYGICSIVGIGAVEFFPKVFVNIVFNPQYYAAIPLIKIIILSILPNAFYLLLRNPLDGISKFPYNTLCLTVSFIFMGSAMYLSKTVKQCAWAFFWGYLVLGIFCYIFWKKCCKQEQGKYQNQERLI